MLIIESKKYIIPVICRQEVENNFVGWWNELEQRFILGSKTNIQHLFKLVSEYYDSESGIMIYLDTKDKTPGYFNFQFSLFLSQEDYSIHIGELIEPNKILYKRTATLKQNGKKYYITDFKESYPGIPSLN